MAIQLISPIERSPLLVKKFQNLAGFCREEILALYMIFNRGITPTTTTVYLSLKLGTLHTTRVHGPCSRAVDTGRVYRTWPGDVNTWTGLEEAMNNPQLYSRPFTTTQ